VARVIDLEARVLAGKDRHLIPQEFVPGERRRIWNVGLGEGGRHWRRRRFLGGRRDGGGARLAAHRWLRSWCLSDRDAGPVEVVDRSARAHRGQQYHQTDEEDGTTPTPPGRLRRR